MRVVLYDVISMVGAGYRFFQIFPVSIAALGFAMVLFGKWT